MNSHAPTRGGPGSGSSSNHLARVHRPSRPSNPSNRSALQFPDVLEHAKEFFEGRKSVPAVVARRVLNAAAPGDGDLVDHLTRERRRRSRMDGSIGGSLVQTAWAAWELMELGARPDDAAVVRMTGYLLTRENQPGRWSEDGLAGDGFFSPGPSGESIAPLTLPSGFTFRAEDDARYVASCLALRTVLRAGHGEREVTRQHIEGLLAVRALDSHLSFVTLGALGMAPPSYFDRIGLLVSDVAGRQRADGSWPAVTLIHAADMLLGVTTPAARAAIRRAAPAIAAMQHEDGSFDETGSEAVALIAVRALDAARTLA